MARKIERMFQAGKSLGQKEAISLRELVEALRQEMERTPEGLVAPAETNNDERPLLLIVDSDRQLAAELLIEANVREIRAEIATNLSAAKDAIYRHPPNVVLLDLSLSNTPEDGLTLLAELSNQVPPLPVLVFTAHNGLTGRVEVARLGGRAFLQKPVAPKQVLEAVTRVLQQVEPAVARVMVVDDDPQILATLRSLLEPWGLKVTTLDDPRQFWETLEASSPELLILDVEMPHLSGIELCQVVRNDLHWGGLPIVFLTAHTEATIVNQVFAVGADDFVSKPIVGPELVTRIINRLERIKLIRSLAQTDPLTGVSNRQKSTQDLDEFFSLALQHNQPLCLATLDLDHFKQVNARYGHATGDAVLRQVGQLLRRAFRGEDLVARWGGEEFVVGMYSMTKSEGVQRLTKVLETLRQQQFIAPDGTKFQVTFSAGVAQYPEDGADLQLLYQSADAALYQAKVAGRDRVFPAAGNT